MKKNFYRFLSHITYGKLHTKYRTKYKAIRDDKKRIFDVFEQKSSQLIDVTNDIISNFNDITQKLNHLTNVINNIDFKQNLFLDYFVKPVDAHPATGALAKRQAENLYLLKTFIEICQKHKLDYWLDFGTLLGAVRHGGFVPWDDDIDVSMTRTDIEKLKEICAKELKSPLFLWDIQTEPFFRLKFNDGVRSEFLDIFPYQETDQGLQIEQNFPIQTYKIPVKPDIIYPLQTIEFAGLMAKAPNKIIQYLEIRYGDWELLPKKRHPIQH